MGLVTKVLERGVTCTVRCTHRFGLLNPGRIWTSPGSLPSCPEPGSSLSPKLAPLPSGGQS